MLKHAKALILKRLVELVNGQYYTFDITREVDSSCFNPSNLWLRQKGNRAHPEDKHGVCYEAMIEKIAGSFLDEKKNIINIGAYQESDGDTYMEFHVYVNQHEWVITKEKSREAVITGDINKLWRYIGQDLKPYRELSFSAVGLAEPRIVESLKDKTK